MYTKLALPIIFLLIPICWGQKNEVTLYDQPDQQGNSVTLSMSSNLAWNDFDNKAVSVCVSGLILFYSSADFREYVGSIYGGENRCTNLTQTGKISSIRYPGFLEDLKRDSITLYGYGFGGTDYREYGDAFNGGYSSSLIVTGGSNWTVFDKLNFEGNSACLMVPDPEKRIPGFLSGVQEIPNFGYAIISGKKGCNNITLNKVHLVPFAKPKSTNANEGKSKSQGEKPTKIPTQPTPHADDLNETAIIDPLLRLQRSNNNSLLANNSEKGNDTINSVNGSTTSKFFGNIIGIFLVCVACAVFCVVCCATEEKYDKRTSGC